MYFSTVNLTKMELPETGSCCKDYKALVDQYLLMNVRNTFGMELPIADEYVVTLNMISKKIIVAKTFSDTVIENQPLHYLLNSLIHAINSGLVKSDDMIAELAAENTPVINL